MVRKTQGLAYPSNPITAIRELQELNAVEPTPSPSPEPPTEPEDPNEGPKVALQVVGADSSDVASAEGREETLVDRSERRSAKGSRRRSATAGGREAVAEGLQVVCAHLPRAAERFGPSAPPPPGRLPAREVVVVGAGEPGVVLVLPRRHLAD